MGTELLFYRLLIILAGILSLFLSLFSYWKLKNAPGARQYMFVTFLSAIFTFLYALELSATTLREIKFWLGLEYVVMPFIPAFILLMCLDYIGIKLRQRYFFILFSIPLVTAFMHHTNELHHLYYTSVGLLESAPFPIIQLEYGPFFYVHSLYLFLCLAISIILLLLQLKKSIFRFRIQLLTMVAGLFVPILANSFYLNDLSPYGIDLGPVSMSISFILHGVALFSFQMFSVVPIARERVFDNMLEGVIVLNHKGVIIDYNQAIYRILPWLNASSIGKGINSVLSHSESLIELISHGKECVYECVEGTLTEHYQVRFSELVNKKGFKIGTIISFVNITDRVEMQRRLSELANYDGLTKLYNRRYFMDQTIAALESLFAQKGNAALIMFDIDHFKMINDTYGHVAGDIVLCEVANLAKNSLGPQDLIARYGGEEFIILLRGRTMDGAVELADSIRKEISESLIHLHDHRIQVTASFGISPIEVTSLDQTEAFKEALRYADQALYMAKDNGRNNVQIHKEQLQMA
ncbi:histidine kinase N-terminal 7TM domain-containing diguanylate cyclase [Ureibacillus sinduriensis]|uniref:Diguanylate cyclase n=1 Tax=Ureibacillus sinduriensis BLB-1 = JCM 15800 TaxID=1384057 RepID=A0A0A3HNP6_9BACL|nr:histidine kinase N-terminal 7TM domain-containing protein [Ureibacillus sinduriensis]KGR74191.1 diguanylate cyclase [Ureibacillus sinduriensis BLB-1 = JCM 15800]